MWARDEKRGGLRRKDSDGNRSPREKEKGTK